MKEMMWTDYPRRAKRTSLFAIRERELLGELQQSDLRPNDLLFLRHFVISVPAEGRVAVPARGENRAPPSAPFRKPTTNVRLSSSYYRSTDHGSSEQLLASAHRSSCRRRSEEPPRTARIRGRNTTAA